MSTIQPTNNVQNNYNINIDNEKKSVPVPLTSTSNKVNKAFWTGIGCLNTFNLIDAGFSRLLALETLTHGTGPLGYVGISLNGADPNWGGGKTGSSAGIDSTHFMESSKNYFYIFKDSAFGEETCNLTPTPFLCSEFGNHLLPRMHAVLSGMATFGSSFESRNRLQKTIGSIAGFLTPTLKFRFTPEEILNYNVTGLENDPDYANAAYRTSKAISNMRLGITGSITQGINLDMLSRMYDHPEKVLRGVVLLGAAALVAKKTYDYVNTQKIESETSETNSTPLSEPKNYKTKLKEKAIDTGWKALELTAIFLNTL